MAGIVRTAVLMLGLAAGWAQAAVLDYSSFNVLGDSLSDVGNVYRTSHGLVPESPPYWHGRFTNGHNWADRVSAVFKDSGLPTSNEAWGGAKARTDHDGVPDLAVQLVTYRNLSKDRRGNRPLVAIWIGANDILKASGRTASRRAGSRAAASVGDAAMALRASGVRDFLIFNMPNLGRIPKYAGNSSGARAAGAGSWAYNDRLDDEIDDLRDAGLRVRMVDAHDLFNRLLENPRDYGLRNVKTPCLDEDDNPCTRRQGKTRAFFDEIHPNYRVHLALADAALDKIGRSGAAAAGPLAATAMPAPAPVPLPAPAALLATGAMALAFVARRRGGAGART